jgi:hypothetical protein
VISDPSRDVVQFQVGEIGSEIAHFPGITFVLTASCEVEEGTQATRGKGRLREVGSTNTKTIKEEIDQGVGTVFVALNLWARSKARAAL